ncbi:MAG: NADH-quinone oxidoreductase subunit B [Anaerolineae bacterium]|jgi:NADH-quinone oxidoreductase subunit B|nr:NADH-quinone oxidoreductase subunit B [Anaerolineae bacterium]
MGLEEKLPDEGFVTTTLEKAINWGRKYSIFPLTFGLACCAIEQIAAGGSRFDIARFGSEVFRASPRQADLLIVSGRVSQKMAPVIKRIYDQMLEPKWVIAMGICASAGGPFNNYAIVQGVDKILPVDVYIPGCPPRPESLLYGLTLLQQKIQHERLRDRRYGQRSEAARPLRETVASPKDAKVAEPAVRYEPKAR